MVATIRLLFIMVAPGMVTFCAARVGAEYRVQQLVSGWYSSHRIRNLAELVESVFNAPAQEFRLLLAQHRVLRYSSEGGGNRRRLHYAELFAGFEFDFTHHPPVRHL
jgi:hypothetical protein